MHGAVWIAGAALAVMAQVISTVAETPTRARAKDGRYISWREHLIDDQQLSGGIKLRGADGLQMADFDKDGHMDIVSVHEDSNHIRLAFGSANPDKWELVTLAEGQEAAAAEDASVGDLNGDDWPDIIVACELAHLIYFQNPGKEVRKGRWPRVIPEVTRNRGSFIRVFFADFNRDGRLEVVSPNKGEQLPTVNPVRDDPGRHPRKEISWFIPPENPLEAKGWVERLLARVEIPINSQPVDIDADGDLDIVAGSRGESRTILFENISDKGGTIRFREHRMEIDSRNAPWIPGAKRLTGFMIDFADFNRDGRLDMVMNETPTTLVWLEQPPSFDKPWIVHRIGHIAPDSPTGITVADINSDGRPDVITGGYSQNPRELDGAAITAESVCGRLAWFENPGVPGRAWIRHDINRTKRGMYDAFIAGDMDKDGDLDFAGTRGNTGNFDGVFWLEQVRTKDPVRSFVPARQKDSAHLPLPKADRVERK
jgi:hypothetical protein